MMLKIKRIEKIKLNFFKNIYSLIRRHKNPFKIYDFRFSIFRSHSDFRLTFVNLISRLLLEFLVLFTFDQREYNENFNDLSFVNFKNFEDILGSYSYGAICLNLKLKKIVQKNPYFRNIMRVERFTSKPKLFKETKAIVYFLFYDKTDIIFNNGLRSLLQRGLFLLKKTII